MADADLTRERPFKDLEAPPDDGPPPWGWDDYKDWVAEEWKRLLDSGAGEAAVQAFLEQHTPLVPGAFPVLAGTTGGHGAFPGAVITQPPLQGLGKRIPDFLWITRDSAFLRPVLVEIEDPGKRWLVGRGQQSAELTQSLEQIREWREWFDQSSNRQVFLDAYRVPEQFRRRRFLPTYVLIFGRVIEGRERIGKLRAHHQAHDQHLITHDHLVADEKASSLICVRNDGAGHYSAVAMPPTAKLSPTYAEWWQLVCGREEMVDADALISKERKAFLLSRIPDWDDWARTELERYA